MVRSRFRNITLIMDCVACDKCRLWGKLQVIFTTCLVYISSRRTIVCRLKAWALHLKCCFQTLKVLHRPCTQFCTVMKSLHYSMFSPGQYSLLQSPLHEIIRVHGHRHYRLSNSLNNLQKFKSMVEAEVGYVPVTMLNPSLHLLTDLTSCPGPGLRLPSTRVHFSY